jgi:hypothetical protein
MKKNPHAVALGRMAKGKKKHISEAEAIRRAKSLEAARENRWIPKDSLDGSLGHGEKSPDQNTESGQA